MTFGGYIFDLDGTIYLGEQAIPGAERAVAALRERGARVVFLSNKPLYSRASYADKLSRLGIPAREEDVIHSSYVLAAYLSREMPGARIYCIGEPPLMEELAAAGMRLVADPRPNGCTVDAVVAGFDRWFDYEKLDCALQAIRRGARFLATNADRTCPVEGGEIPDCGGIIGAIEGVTGQSVDLVAGKPSAMTVDIALARLDVDREACLVVGDRLETDILMGNRAGVRTALVLTGVTRREDVEAGAPAAPDYLLESVSEVPDLRWEGPS